MTGYMKLKGEAHRRSKEEGRKDADLIYAQALEALDKYRQELLATEDALILCGRILDYSLPEVSGKMGIRWWKTNSRNGYREPVLVRWAYNQGVGGETRAKPRKVANIKSGIKSYRNGKIAIQAAQEARHLIERWKSLRSRIIDFSADRKKYESAVLYHGRDIKDVKLGLMMLKEVLIRSLEEEGRGVPDEFIDAGKE